MKYAMLHLQTLPIPASHPFGLTSFQAHSSAFGLRTPSHTEDARKEQDTLLNHSEITK